MRSIIRIGLILLFILNLTSCKAVRNDIVDNNYKLEKIKSKQTDFSSIVVNAYDFENKKELAGIVYVNDVVFFMEFDENKKKVKPLVITPNTNNYFDVEVSYIRRYTVKIDKFFVKRGDSIVINAYLKEDKRPIID
ncbi:hypothetical protein [Tenacibaculum sp.]|uniref:hypothetical protein n=1 Tax=Tenacibaculum sp. TaxID=1906242 RepID=UPI003D1096AD